MLWLNAFTAQDTSTQGQSIIGSERKGKVTEHGTGTQGQSIIGSEHKGKVTLRASPSLVEPKQNVRPDFVSQYCGLLLTQNGTEQL